MSVGTDICQFELLKAVEQFLYREARLMDEHLHDEWLALWTERCLYYAPVNEEDIDPRKHVTLFYEDRNALENRIMQMKSAVNWSQWPRSRVRRVISNVEVHTPPDGTVTVESNFSLVEVRREQQQVLAGRCFHTLHPEGNSFKIAYKKVLLVNIDAVMRNIRVLL
jgi:3-phenylpropionate/cinnamic acid dioxygenase small subunit